MTARRRSPSSCSSARELSGRELANTLGKRVAATPAMQLGQGEYDAVRVHQYAAPGQKAAEVDMRTWSRGDDGRRLVLVDGKTKADQPLEAGPESFPDSSTKETPPDVLRARTAGEGGRGRHRADPRPRHRPTARGRPLPRRRRRRPVAVHDPPGGSRQGTDALAG
jgi:hypothetical protein